MRVALFSDVHGNTLGLRAVLEAIDRSGGADVLCAAGDLVGGGSGTDEVMDMLLSRPVRLVRGNAEDYVTDLERCLTREREDWRRRFLRARAEWVIERLSPSHLRVLRELPQSLTIDLGDRRLLVCHSTPGDPAGTESGDDAPGEAVERAYGAADAEVVAYGHIHQAHVRNAAGKLLINVASVGSRPQHDGLSAYTLIDCADGACTVSQHLVPFDAQEEARRCAAASLPDFAAFRPLPLQ